jgi:hypothetical protein
LYNVWRGGSEAHNKAVWWGANKFIARYNVIDRISFNSGGGSSGYADSAYVKIYRNEAMTDFVAEVYVPNIVDWGETIANFTPVNVTPGQPYWWQVHSGSGSQRILLYFSNYGGDYSEGCSYWRTDINESSCLSDLNGVVHAIQ